MNPTVLGLDIGGANLKAATQAGRAVSVPFPLWKHPDRLATELAALIQQFPETDTLAVTMTGELCDCYSTKEEGVNRILDAVEEVAKTRPVKVWATVGGFLNVQQARENYLAVAASNWHALATLVGLEWPTGSHLLLDIGSTTTDIIPLALGKPATQGLTDPTRLANNELVYTGVRRTPVFALLPDTSAAELFATTLDVYLLRGNIPEDDLDLDTADGRAATVPMALARMARVRCHDTVTATEAEIRAIAEEAHTALMARLVRAVQTVAKNVETVIVSGSGEFLANAVARAALPHTPIVSLTAKIGPALSSAAPAFAVAALGERL